MASTQNSTDAFVDSKSGADVKDQLGTTASSTISDETYLNPTNINEKSFLRKLDLKLLPPLTLLYLLSFLDRSNIGNAKLEGLTKDLNISGTMYLDTLTIYFVGYILFEVPCNIVLKRTTPRFWLPTLMVIWGIVATLLGVCTNFAGFMVARFFLGVAEAGLFPGVVYYLSMWYKRNEQHYRVALFFSAASLAGAFGGVLAWGIGHMDGVAGLHGWHWIFFLEGIFTVLAAIVSYFLIYNYPDTAEFLSPAERDFIQARLAADSDATRVEGFDWANVVAALKDYKCYMYGLCFHTMSLPLYTLSLFLPTIIKELGYTEAHAQLLTVPPYAIATVLTVIVAIVSERTRRRALFIMISSGVAVVGYIILLTAPSDMPSVSYGGTILAASGIYPATAIVLSWPANNVSGQTKRATACAMTISIGNLGAVVGTQLYRPGTSPRFHLGHGFACGYLVANVCIVGALWYLLERENKARREGKRDHRLEGLQGDGFLGDEDPKFVFQT